MRVVMDHGLNAGSSPLRNQLRIYLLVYTTHTHSTCTYMYYVYIVHSTSTMYYVLCTYTDVPITHAHAH